MQIAGDCEHTVRAGKDRYSMVIKNTKRSVIHYGEYRVYGSHIADREKF